MKLLLASTTLVLTLLISCSADYEIRPAHSEHITMNHRHCDWNRFTLPDHGTSHDFGDYENFPFDNNARGWVYLTSEEDTLYENRDIRFMDAVDLPITSPYHLWYITADTSYLHIQAVQCPQTNHYFIDTWTNVCEPITVIQSAN